MSLKISALIFVLFHIVVARTHLAKHVSKKTVVWYFDSRDPVNEKHADTFTSLRKSLIDYSKMSFLAVDCSQQGDRCKFVNSKTTSSYLLYDGERLIDVYYGSQDLENLRRYCILQMGGKALRTLPADDSKAEIFDVPHLTNATFDEEIQTNNYTFCMFYAPWCGHCKKFKPFWKKLYNIYKNNTSVKIRAVDCVAEQKSRLCFRKQVDGFPTIYMFDNNGKNLGEYFGGKNTKKMVKFIDSRLSEERIKAYELKQLEKQKKIEAKKAQLQGSAKVDDEKSLKARNTCSVTEGVHEMCVPEWAKNVQ